MEGERYPVGNEAFYAGKIPALDKKEPEVEYHLTVVPVEDLEKKREILVKERSSHAIGEIIKLKELIKTNPDLEVIETSIRTYAKERVTYIAHDKVSGDYYYIPSGPEEEPKQRQRGELIGQIPDIDQHDLLELKYSKKELMSVLLVRHLGQEVTPIETKLLERKRVQIPKDIENKSDKQKKKESGVEKPISISNLREIGIQQVEDLRKEFKSNHQKNHRQLAEINAIKKVMDLVPDAQIFYIDYKYQNQKGSPRESRRMLYLKIDDKLYFHPGDNGKYREGQLAILRKICPNTSDNDFGIISILKETIVTPKTNEPQLLETVKSKVKPEIKTTIEVTNNVEVPRDTLNEIRRRYNILSSNHNPAIVAQINRIQESLLFHPELDIFSVDYIGPKKNINRMYYVKSGDQIYYHPDKISNRFPLKALKSLFPDIDEKNIRLLDELPDKDFSEDRTKIMEGISGVFDRIDNSYNSINGILFREKELTDMDLENKKTELANQVFNSLAKTIKESISICLGKEKSTYIETAKTLSLLLLAVESLGSDLIKYKESRQSDGSYIFNSGEVEINGKKIKNINIFIRPTSQTGNMDGVNVETAQARTKISVFSDELQNGTASVRIDPPDQRMGNNIIFDLEIKKESFPTPKRKSWEIDKLMLDQKAGHHFPSGIRLEDFGSYTPEDIHRLVIDRMRQLSKS